MAFELGLGIEGVWWGLALGLALVAGALLAWVRFRGPAHPVEQGTPEKPVCGIGSVFRAPREECESELDSRSVS